MSLKCIDDAMRNKLLSVYPNVVFGPLSRALVTDADTENLIGIEGDVKSTDPSQFVVSQGETTNEHATETYTPTYGDRSEDNSIRGTVAFPLIALDRLNNPFAFEYQANDPMTRRGRYIIESKTFERALPVTPTYQIDIISDRRVEVDDLWREIVMYLYTHDNLEVVYSPGTEEEFVECYPIHLLDTDNTTDVDTFSDVGYVYRQTITLEITNAKLLFDSKAPIIEKIPVRYINYNKEDDEDE